MGTPGRVRQAEYYARNRERLNREKRDKYQERLEAGLCPKCGEPPDEEDYIACSDCRKYHAAGWRRWKAGK